MKKMFLSVITVLLAGSFFSILTAQEDISNIFKAGVVDMNKVAEGYLNPAGKSFAVGLGSNWYNTAAVHKTWGFDLTFGVGAVQAPAADQSFSLTGLTNLKPAVAGTTQAPSFTGSGDGVLLNLMQPQTVNGKANPLYPGVITSFTTPSGVSKYVPTASIQFTIGLPIINDLSIRLVPTVKVKGFEASIWGIGIKHNIKQWIPVVKDLPFDAALLLAYSKFDMKYAFPAESRITPDNLVSGGSAQYIADPNSNDYTTQGMKVSAASKTVNLIFSKKISVLTPFIGFGVTQSDFTLNMVGNYPTLGEPVLSGTTYKMQIKNITNPINLTPPSETMTNATLGLRVKLAIITIHAQYAFQKYPVASAGFGISFR